MKKTDEDNSETYGDMLEKHGEEKTLELLNQDVFHGMKIEALRYEKDASFDIKPNYTFWKKAPYWTLDEAIALSIECDPEYLNSKAIKDFHESFLSLSQTIKIFKALKELATRSINNQELKVKKNTSSDDIAIKPSAYISWLKQNNFPVVDALNDENWLKSKRGRPKGSVGYDDEERLEYMYALRMSSNNKVSINKAAMETVEKFGKSGANPDADQERLRKKFVDKFGD